MKIGDEVYVIHCHINGCDEKGIVVRQGRERPYIGKWWIDLGYTQIAVEEDRIVDKDVYGQKFKKDVPTPATGRRS